MSIKIVPHSAAFRDAVAAFNQRMCQGGSAWGFYEEPEPDWLAKQPGVPVWREYYLAVEDEVTVRGGFALKPQDWLIQGEVKVVTDWQGPFSEGAFDPKWNTLGLRMVRDMLKKQPLLYSWGHGGEDQPIVQMLRKMGWRLHETPLCLKIHKPHRFLRLNAYLRSTPKRRLALDLLALSGAASLGIPLLHLALRVREGKGPDLSGMQVVEEARFGEWADELWERCKGQYSAIAVRNALCMNALAPDHGWREVFRLRVQRAGQTLGWALVMDTQMRGDARYGELRVGSLVDCLAAPDDAGVIVAAADRFLRKRGVDLVVSNQAHPKWAVGFSQNGYLVLPKRRLFAMSPPLLEALSPFDQVARGLHLTNMDGHGPMAL